MTKYRHIFAATFDSPIRLNSSAIDTLLRTINPSSFQVFLVENGPVEDDASPAIDDVIEREVRLTQKIESPYADEKETLIGNTATELARRKAR